MAHFFFVIVNRDDCPVYECEIGAAQNDDRRQLNQFVVHAALDIVQEAMWNTNNMFLKHIDKFNEFYVSAFVTASGVRFFILHDGRNEDGIKSFFGEVYELFVRLYMNPFFDISQSIQNTLFDTKVKNLGKKFLL